MLQTSSTPTATGFEIRFQSLFREGRALTFPCADCRRARVLAAVHSDPRQGVGERRLWSDQIDCLRVRSASCLAG
jgi:hypothetical protein